ncbi:hypothetical protein DRN73_09695 [Candidatus Pacearchaeota archaeon]|nr:MAG: hypothetical protein DRN73_09695 [Candidatus Pacearchaeota archaeon]
MKHFKCPHNELQANCEEVYCRKCKSLIFSIEETKRREMKLNKMITKNPKFVVTIKFMENFK